jgi:ferric-dicitrate binding protein FerR (iron transport regulator)
MNPSITKDLLFAYFAGHASALQKRMIDAWATEPEAEEQFYRWLDEWERLHPQYQTDLTPRLHQFQTFARPTNRRPEGTAPSTIAPPSTAARSVRRMTRWRWAAAASLGLLLAGGWFWERGWYRTYQTTYNETRSILLPDGSRAVLNANSSLRLPRYGFGSRTRRVRLDGEAEFSVVHTATHQPFVVSTARDLNVVVLGTEFTVFSRPRASQVVLKQGKVRLRYETETGARQLTLRPGDVMTLAPDGRVRLQTTRQPETYSAWKDRRVVFEKTSLSEIANLLEENYGLHVEIPDPEMARLTLSGAFTARRADELLRTVTDALGLGYRREGDTVYLTPSPTD